MARILFANTLSSRMSNEPTKSMTTERSEARDWPAGVAGAARALGGSSAGRWTGTGAGTGAGRGAGASACFGVGLGAGVGCAVLNHAFVVGAGAGTNTLGAEGSLGAWFDGREGLESLRFFAPFRDGLRLRGALEHPR